MVYILVNHRTYFEVSLKLFTLLIQGRSKGKNSEELVQVYIGQRNFENKSCGIEIQLSNLRI